MDFLQTSHDRIETDPPELEPLLIAAMAAGILKDAAVQGRQPWPEQLETELQRRVAALVAAAQARGLRTFDVIVTRPDGSRAVVKMDVALIAKSRALQ